MDLGKRCSRGRPPWAQRHGAAPRRQRHGADARPLRGGDSECLASRAWGLGSEWKRRTAQGRWRARRPDTAFRAGSARPAACRAPGTRIASRGQASVATRRPRPLRGGSPPPSADGTSNVPAHTAHALPGLPGLVPGRSATHAGCRRQHEPLRTPLLGPASVSLRTATLGDSGRTIAAPLHLCPVPTLTRTLGGEWQVRLQREEGAASTPPPPGPRPCYAWVQTCDAGFPRRASRDA